MLNRLESLLNTWLIAFRDKRRTSHPTESPRLPKVRCRSKKNPFQDGILTTVTCFHSNRRFRLRQLYRPRRSQSLNDVKFFVLDTLESVRRKREHVEECAHPIVIPVMSRVKTRHRKALGRRPGPPKKTNLSSRDSSLSCPSTGTLCPSSSPRKSHVSVIYYYCRMNSFFNGTTLESIDARGGYFGRSLIQCPLDRPSRYTSFLFLLSV